MDYEETKGERMIYRTYADTEIAELDTKVECPYCEEEDMVNDMSECGKTYTIECENCGKEYKMYFDAS